MLTHKLLNKGTTPVRLTAVAVAALVAAVALIACSSETVVTVEVPVTTQPERIVETVVVERPVEVAGETVIQTVVVERPVEVAGETVVQTVVVERQVQVAGETVVQTVVVEQERVVQQTVVVEQTVQVQVEVEVTPTPEPIRSPFITDDPAAGSDSWPTIYDANGDLFPKPSSFKEAPMLAAMVAAGDLPPVEERLPENPLVIQPAGGIGKYGGTWYRAFTGPADGQNMERPMKDHLLFFNTGMTDPQPNIAESWTVNDDSTEFTFTLRKGLKWSDGEPFTTDDIMFWVDNIWNNEDLTPSKPAWTIHGGEPLQFEKVDDQTFKVTAAEPYGIFVQLVASVIVAGPHTRGDRAGGLYAPSHYLQQFHPTFVGEDEAQRLASEAGYDNWATHFLFRNHANANPDSPMMTAWRVTQSIATNEWAFERNPYYYAVDTEGNQLPYMDRVVLSLAQNLEVLNLKAIAGDFTVQGRHIDISKLPLFLQNAESVGYRVQFWRQPQSGIANVYFNESWAGNDEIASLLRNADFRRALSMGIERDQINEVFFLGLGSVEGLCFGFDDPNNPGKYVGEDYVRYNPDRANSMLDDLGLDKRDGDGLRLLPSGEKLVIELPSVVAAFEDYVGINEMIGQQWKNNLGVDSTVQPLERSLHGDRAEANELMTQNWESSGRDAVLITPQHLLPVAGNNFITPLGTQYFDGEAGGVEPTSEFILEQQRLYAEGISTAGPARFAEITQRVVEVNCEAANPVTTVMNKPTYVAIIKNEVRNIPNPLPFSYHSQTSGNGFPETWWLDVPDAMEGQ